MLDPPLYCVNLGYDANDNGFTNSLVNTNPPQGVLELVGFSATLTNLCLSYNPLTNINVSGWPALQDLECWHCTNMLSVGITNCPQLSRVCFEAIQYDSEHGITGRLDFAGCPKIADVRAADNRLSNIIFANGAGPLLWHLCIHDNSVNQLAVNVDFSQFPSLSQLWIWDNYFSGPLALTSANCSNLTSVEAFGNYFASANFSGQTNLDHIWMGNNPTMTNLNVTGCQKLRQVEAYSGNLPSSAVDSALIALDQMGLSASTASGLEVQLYGGGNAAPSVDGRRAAENLKSKGWYPVYYTLPPSGTPQISSLAIAPGSNTATITWATTNAASDSTVYYGTTKAFGSSTNNASIVTNHSITLMGLTTNTTYYFYVHSTAGADTGTSGDNQFTTHDLPNTKPIWFTNTSSSVSMQVAVDSGATVTWFWGDGTVSNGLTSVTKTLGSTSYSNAVVVDPASALTGFGLNCGSTTTLSGVGGLTNYPNLQELHLYQSGLSSLSLAGCSNLVSIALVTTAPSSAVENAWFNDLAAAEPAMPGGSTRFACGNTLHVFYFPTSPGTNSTSAGACSNLVRIGWSLQHYP
jgi:hypothetical protein